MHITQQRDTVSLAGDLDLQCWTEVRDCLLQVLRDKNCVVVNVSQVQYVDSQGLGAILAVIRTAHDAGLGRDAVVLRGPRRRVLRLVEMSAIDRLVQVQDPEQTTA
ncbi:MAG TPA: STAS domain-containing protein [Candidatus Xenobia bacterium]|jgi:anti-anti-sigma factor